MKHLQYGLFILFLFIHPALKAQQNHFIYIQTENNQAFYIKLENKLFSSSASGYLLLPKLKDGNYQLSIGFPKSQWPEQKFGCTIDNNDIGYLLKNFESRGWGLFNLQTLAVVMAGENVKIPNVEVVNKTDAFSTMLSTVVNDSTIRQTAAVKEEEKKAPMKEGEKALPNELKEMDTLQKLVAVEAPKEAVKSTGLSEVKTNPETTKEIERTETVKDQPAPINSSRSVITRSLFNKNAEGTEMVFIDEADGKKDTVRVFIPADKNAVAEKEENTSKIKKPGGEPGAELVKKEDKIKDTRFLEIEVPDPNKKPEDKKPVENTLSENKVPENNVAENKVVENKEFENTKPEKKDVGKGETKNLDGKPLAPVIQKSPMINSDCKSQATDEDFLKLRKKMAAEDNDEKMIAIAKKLFKAKCFTVEQVKNLSVLFLNDSGKYTFFDTAYPFVSDSHNFSSLQNQLSDAYYLNRFLSMIRH